MNIYSYGKFMDNTKLNNLENYNFDKKILDKRKAAIVHKQVRKEAMQKIKPGAKVLDICNYIESRATELLGKNNLQAGIAFPVGFSFNNIAAHDSAIPNDNRVIKKGDMVKVDIGTHVNGEIIDSAFTISYANEEYNTLLKASREAVWGAIKMAGVDVLLEDLTQEITDIVSSYEIIKKDGTSISVNPCIGLAGHNIKSYTIHGGKLIYNNMKSLLYSARTNHRMESGETYAIEVFTSSGTGIIQPNNEMHCTHYMINKNHQRTPFNLDITKQVYQWIVNNRLSLPFSSKWLHSHFGDKYQIGLKELMSKNIITGYPPLEDKDPKAYTSQFEHTIYLHDFGKEVMSQDHDY
jgi:methionyl aminopeptidase